MPTIVFVRHSMSTGEPGDGGVIVDFLRNTLTAEQLAALNPAYRDMANCALTQIDADPGGYALERLAVSLA